MTMNLELLISMSNEELRRALDRLRKAGEEQHADDIAAIERELARREPHDGDWDIDFQ
jgi:hypothetical protein